MVTASLMRALDARAIGECGIPGAVLMENAGRAVFEHLLERFGPVRDRRFHVLAGTGNNGGDGFVAARYLRLAGARVSLAVVGEAERISGDAATHYRLLTPLGLRSEPVAAAGSIKVDALLGTGATGPPRPEVAHAIRWMNADTQPTISVDIPSGVMADTGATPGDAVRAVATVTLGYPKVGMLLAPGSSCCGEIVVRDIGFPWDALDVEAPCTWIVAESILAGLRPRRRDDHKGAFGHVLIVGGSLGMSGAPVLAARAALRSGVGLVTVAAPDRTQAAVASRLDEAMTLALPEEVGGLAECAADAALSAARRAGSVCVGPGLGASDAARRAVGRIVRGLEAPVVLDADGLNALADEPDMLRVRSGDAVLTPHPGEAGRLLGCSAADVQADRLGAARELAARFGAVVALKGAGTLVCDGRATTEGVGAKAAPLAINSTGNPGMATGGSGDVLTGVIGALIAQGLDAFDAACLGVFVHGRAGDLAAARRGQVSMVAGDIVDALPEAIRELEVEG